MHAEILTKQQYEKWDAFAYTHPYSSIHQTSRWAHFQSNVAARDKFWIIGIFEEKSLIAGTVLIRHKMPKGYTWLYAPRGPLLSYDDPTKAKEQMNALLTTIKEIAKGEKTIFLRIDPLIEIQNGFQKPSNDPKSLHVQTPKRTLHFPHFHFSHLGYQPEDTLILDITPEEEEILAQMKEKGRYNIRLASKKNIKIVEVKASSKESEAQIKAYFDILQETLERDKFHGHGISFYKNMVEKLATQAKLAAPSPAFQGFSQMLLAYHQDPATNQETPIAGIIATFYKDTGMYYFGASSNAHRNLMAPYLLQWHAIQIAKKHNLTKYDFLGIAPISETEPLGPRSHHWRGVTEFKTKFGGIYIKYLPPQDFAFKPLLYRAYTLAKTLRKKMR